MDWVRGVRVGQGSFATVDLAAPRGGGAQGLPPVMAVKSCGFAKSAALMEEKLILDELRDCPNVVGCFGESVSYENGEKLYNVLLEYAAGGDLAARVRNSGDRRLPEFDVRRYTKGVIRGLDYIHKAGIVHCDIKLQNILLQGQNGVVKIADFGLAKRLGARNGDVLRGTPMYMSPEMVAGGEVGAAADIWAVGCAVAEMIAGAPAWRCADLAGLLLRIGAGDELPEIPDDLSADGQDFLTKCFVKDPSKRWTAEMLLDHPFISGQDLADGEAATASTSPRCVFNFPDWASSITSLPSPEYSSESSSQNGSWSSAAAGRRLGIVSGSDGPKWSVSDEWVTVR
ncbi:mitogen-activated protein kinase kinase kinase 20-like [Andrographis paniculata]|uniref:mitogen-activated protein kinase kinase kinase 20-like n=1 Tax=Andrographis paniculata TaxID=175694 RepID=UPI0021E97C60|nr:mitogen-activated protein kinase kinase kinase 20-like [Andrographis paniculata]